jgi:hypothetical protein
MLEAAMRPPKYALTPLFELRESKVREASRELAKRAEARVLAEGGRRAAEERRDAHSVIVEQVRKAEGTALDRGELRAADLARADAWELRVAAERAAIEAEVKRARTTEARAREGEHSARGDLIAGRADADVVANDRARWNEGMRKRADTKEEEAASETWRPK